MVHGVVGEAGIDHPIIGIGPARFPIAAVQDMEATGATARPTTGPPDRSATRFTLARETVRETAQVITGLSQGQEILVRPIIIVRLVTIGHPATIVLPIIIVHLVTIGHPVIIAHPMAEDLRSSR